MSTKFHVNPETGNPGPCSAKEGNCPFGSEEEHHSTREEAQSAYEKSQGRSFSTVSSNGNGSDEGWYTRDEAREELGVSRLAFAKLEESGALKFRGPNNDMVMGRDLKEYRDGVTAKVEAHGFKPGKTNYEKMVVVHAQRVPDDSGKHPETVSVLVPNVQRLTENKKLNIAKKAWVFSGRSEEAWDQGSREQQLGWANVRMGSGQDTEVEVVGDHVSWTSKWASSSHSVDNVKLIAD